MVVVVVVVRVWLGEMDCCFEEAPLFRSVVRGSRLEMKRGYVLCHAGAQAGLEILFR